MKKHLLSLTLCGASLFLMSPCILLAQEQETATTTTTSMMPSTMPSTATPAPCSLGKCEGIWLHHRKHELEFLSKSLSLSEEQKTRIKAILEQRYMQLQALHQNASISKEARKDEAKKIFRVSHDKLMAVLTPDQKAKMHQIRKVHIEKEESASHCSDPNCTDSICPTASTMPMPSSE